VGLTNIVARALPFQLTTDPATNPPPFTVSENPWAPGSTTLGTKGLLMNGTGFVCAPSRAERPAQMVVRMTAFAKARMHTSRFVVSQPNVDIDSDQQREDTAGEMRTSACTNQ